MQIADLINKVLMIEPQIINLAQELRNEKSLLVMGRGYNYATCLEGALVCFLFFILFEQFALVEVHDFVDLFSSTPLMAALCHSLASTIVHVFYWPVYVVPPHLGNCMFPFWSVWCYSCGCVRREISCFLLMNTTLLYVYSASSSCSVSNQSMNI